MAFSFGFVEATPPNSNFVLVRAPQKKVKRNPKQFNSNQNEQINNENYLPMYHLKRRAVKCEKEKKK